MSKLDEDNSKVQGDEDLLLLDALAYYAKLSDKDWNKEGNKSDNSKSMSVGDFIDSINNYPDAYHTVFDNALGYTDSDLGMDKIIDLVDSNESLKNLVMVYPGKPNDDTTSSVCFISPDTCDVYITFCGNYAAGTYEYINENNEELTLNTWVSNAMGAVEADTGEQMRALDFYEKSIAAARDYYGDQDVDLNITVSGHSAGGNFAQYVSIAYRQYMGDEYDEKNDIDRCVSFDGQGFSAAFLEKYSEDISNRAGSITSYCPTKSYVGALMNDIPGINNKYIDIGEPNAKLIGYHMPAELIDENGDFKAEGVMSLESALLKAYTISSVEITKQLPGVDIQSAAESLGYFLNDTMNGMPMTDAIKKDISNKDALALLGFLTTEVTATAVAAVKIPNVAVAAVSLGEIANTVASINDLVERGDIQQAVEKTCESVSKLATGFKMFSMGMATGHPAVALAGFAVGLCLGGKAFEFAEDMVYEFEKMLAEGWDSVKNFLDSLDDLFDSAASLIAYVADPLVIDLDNDGFELTTVKDGVYFDNNNFGLAEKTQWVSADDGLLTLDLNSDGLINDGSELFGTSTKLVDGTFAKSGFEALAQYDENGDGIIDENDEVYSRLLIWQDINGNGMSEMEELKSLKDMGIDSISLSTNDCDGVKASAINYADGTLGKVGEFSFESQLYDSREKESVEISEEIQKLPNIRAIGNIASLHTLMQLDTTGTLTGYVNDFVFSSDRTEKENIITNILYFISGADKVESHSRGSNFDAKKLKVIEEFMGRNFVGTNGANPVNTAASVLEEIYKGIFEIYYNLLNGQTVLKGYLTLTFWEEDNNGNRYLNTDLFNAYVSECRKYGHDMSEIVGAMGRYIYSVNGTNKDNFKDYYMIYLNSPAYAKAIAQVCIENTYVGDSLNNSLSGTESKDILFGGAGDDVLYGYDGDDILYGEEGDDKLYGGSGDDILTGGAGSDYMQGGTGNDTYIFNLGDGESTIYDYENSATSGREDRIVFGEGITAESISMERNGDNLVIKYGECDSITVRSVYYYGDGRCFVENIEFADGSRLTKEDINMMAGIHNGTDGADTMTGYASSSGYSQDETFYAGAGNDTVYGYDGNDVLYGEEGDDKLYGGSGDDILTGGAGSDYMQGGTGNDTYIFNLGDGESTIYDYENSATSGREDRIVFGEGITAESISMERNGDNLVIKYGECDSITVRSAYYYGDGRCFVENIEFADGSRLTKEDINMMAGIHKGTDGADTMTGYASSSGYSQDEIFYAGAGNDTVYGYDGNDVLYGEEGDDKLYGGSGDDILTGGAGSDYMQGGTGNDTYIFNLGDGESTIYDYENSAISGREDRIVFGEGITAESISMERNGDNLVIKYGECDSITVRSAYYYGDGRCFVENIEFADGSRLTKEDINMMAGIHNGTDGADTMTGYASSSGYSQDETFYAGAGNDTVYGYDGDDILYGEEGDDKLYGGSGDDILTGGAGSDYMQGGTGNDTYIFNLGDGESTIYDYENSATSGREDRIVFGEGITAESISMERNGDNLVIKYGECDSITVRSAYYYADGRCFVENIEFADGTVLNADEIEKIVSLSNTICGGISDTDYEVSFTKQQGIYDMGGNDAIYLGANMLDIVFEKSGNDLIISDISEDGALTITDWYTSDTHRIENIYSNDGYSITDIQIQLLIDNMASFSIENGVSVSDIIALQTEESSQLFSQFWQKEA